MDSLAKLNESKPNSTTAIPVCGDRQNDENTSSDPSTPKTDSNSKIGGHDSSIDCFGIAKCLPSSLNLKDVNVGSVSQAVHDVQNAFRAKRLSHQHKDECKQSEPGKCAVDTTTEPESENTADGIGDQFRSVIKLLVLLHTLRSLYQHTATHCKPDHSKALELLQSTLMAPKFQKCADAPTIAKLRSMKTSISESATPAESCHTMQVASSHSSDLHPPSGSETGEDDSDDGISDLSSNQHPKRRKKDPRQSKRDAGIQKGASTTHNLALKRKNNSSSVTTQHPPQRQKSPPLTPTVVVIGDGMLQHYKLLQTLRTEYSLKAVERELLW